MKVDMPLNKRYQTKPSSKLPQRCDQNSNMFTSRSQSSTLAITPRRPHLNCGIKNFLRNNYTKMFIWMYYACHVPDIIVMVRVYANGLGFNPRKVIPKTQKLVLDASFTPSILRYGSRVKWSNRGKVLAPLWCSGFRKESLRVTRDYSRQLYFFSYVCHSRTT